MLKKILPSKICEVLFNKLNVKLVYELRLRASRPITVNYGGEYRYLTSGGYSDNSDNALFADSRTLQDVVVRASDYSLYTVNRNICEGFITIEGGIRIGVAGEYVWDNGRIKTIKNFSGLTIRIPHEIKGCADKLMRYFSDGDIKNCLIMSPPACGKTTILRDLCRQLGNAKPRANILLIDERSEIAASVGGIPQLDVGINVDVLTGCSKKSGMTHAIRSMNPYLIITDELATDEDIAAATAATCSGVKIIASVHAADQYDLMNKTTFDRAIKNRLFQRYAVLSNKPCVGTLSGLYDENFSRIY